MKGCPVPWTAGALAGEVDSREAALAKDAMLARARAGTEIARTLRAAQDRAWTGIGGSVQYESAIIVRPPARPPKAQPLPTSEYSMVQGSLCAARNHSCNTGSSITAAIYHRTVSESSAP